MHELRPSVNYIKSIDGLRALSIFMVICFHCNLFNGLLPYQRIPYLFLNSMDLGVSCFFVISGFLITGILVDTREHPNFYKNFFFRRVLRIFPLYYLILFVAFVILPNFDHPRSLKWAATEPMWYWLYLSNFYIAISNKFNHGLVDLSWSLSIEEQFYLVWPWIVLCLRPLNLVKACYLGILISILSRLYLKSTGYSEYGIHLFTFCRLDGLLVGAMLALERRDLISLKLFKTYRLKIVVVLGLVLLTLILSESPTVNFMQSVFSYTLVAILFGAVVSLLIESDKSIFTNKVLISIGKYSYGIYLIHNAVQRLLRELFIDSFASRLSNTELYFLQIVFVLVILLFSYVFSYIIYNSYEKHFLKLKKYFSY